MVQRLSSRLTWHDFAYVTMVQKVRSGSVTPPLSPQSDLFKRSGPLHTRHPGPRVTTPGAHIGLWRVFQGPDHIIYARLSLPELLFRWAARDKVPLTNFFCVGPSHPVLGKTGISGNSFGNLLVQRFSVSGNFPGNLLVWSVFFSSKTP